MASHSQFVSWPLLASNDVYSQLRPKCVKALLGHRVVQVACGSRDAQTLALTDEGMVFR